MNDQIQDLRKRVFGGQKKKVSAVKSIIDMARHFSCIPDILGREYEIRDAKGKVVFTVVQKKMTLRQLDILIAHFVDYKKKEQEAISKQTKRGGR